MEQTYCTVEEALEELRAGRIIITIDVKEAFAFIIIENCVDDNENIVIGIFSFDVLGQIIVDKFYRLILVIFFFAHS